MKPTGSALSAPRFATQAIVPKTVPGDEVRAQRLAQKVRDSVMAVLDPYLSGG